MSGIFLKGNLDFFLISSTVEVGNLVNQHPTGHIPNDVNDGKYLCLKDMLLVGAAPEVPQGPFHHMKTPRHSVEFVQKIVDSLSGNVGAETYYQH